MRKPIKKKKDIQGKKKATKTKRLRQVSKTSSVPPPRLSPSELKSYTELFNHVTLDQLIDLYLKHNPENSLAEYLMNLTPKKRTFLITFKRRLCNVTHACEASGITRETYYDWRSTDPIFKRAADEIKESAKDFAESVLMSNIVAKKEASTMFYLKCQAKDRGYVEKSELALSGAVGVYPVEQLSTEQLQEIVTRGVQLMDEVEQYKTKLLTYEKKGGKRAG